MLLQSRLAGSHVGKFLVEDHCRSGMPKAFVQVLRDGYAESVEAL